MAILAEKIAAQVVQLHACERDFYDKMTEHRLETITWHYNLHLPEMEGLLSEVSKLEKRAKTDPFARMQLEGLKLQLPLLRTGKFLIIIFKFLLKYIFTITHKNSNCNTFFKNF
jgi:hypothetical protein